MAKYRFEESPSMIHIPSYPIRKHLPEPTRWLAKTIVVTALLLAAPLSSQLWEPDDLTYRGTIAPPKIGGGQPRFAYGMFGLEYDPTCAGEPDPSPNDGFPGCLVGTSSKQYDMIAMFDIPRPREVTRGDYEAVPKGSLIVDFFKCSKADFSLDIQEQLDKEPLWDARDIPGVARSESGDWICTCGHDWYNVMLTDYRSHCWFDFDSRDPNSQGAYGWGETGDTDFHSQRMAWYLGAIPQDWADAELEAKGEAYCFSGMQRMGGGCEACSGGPTIYAFPCSRPNSSPEVPLRSAQQLLGYPNVYPIQVYDKPHPDYSVRSQARGATWVDETLVVSAYKGGDYWWYGLDDPWADSHAHRNTCLFNKGNPESCFLAAGPTFPPGTKDYCQPGSHGFHALLDPTGANGPQYTATLQFYDTDKLAEVAAGRRQPSSILPFATIEAPGELWNRKCAQPGDLAYDAESHKLYWVEFNGDDPLIHVYDVGMSFRDGFESGDVLNWWEEIFTFDFEDGSASPFRWDAAEGVDAGDRLNDSVRD